MASSAGERGMRVFERLMSIDDRLRETLLSLEEGFSVRLDPDVVRKIFTDSLEDQVSEKQYRLIDTSDLRVFAFVEDYEPETLWLRLEIGPIRIATAERLFLVLFPD